MSDFSRYKNIAIGTFFSIATPLMVASLCIVYTQEGFTDFKSISTAIVSLEKTSQPMVDIAPNILVEMEQMNETITLMQESLAQTNNYVYGMSTSIHSMSNTVPYQMDRMHTNMGPMGMMPMKKMPFFN